MVLVICPSIFEYRFLKSLRLPKDTRLVLSGMGKLRALHACHEACPAPSYILLVGYAGSLSRSLRIGDLIEPDVFIEQDYDARPFELFPHRVRSLYRKLFARSKRAVMLTQDRFLTENPFAGTPFARRYPNLACDMESYAVAFYCRLKRVPFSVLKFISDSADGSADHDFLKACQRLAPALRRTVLQALSIIHKKGAKK